MFKVINYVKLILCRKSLIMVNMVILIFCGGPGNVSPP